MMGVKLEQLLLWLPSRQQSDIDNMHGADTLWQHACCRSLTGVKHKVHRMKINAWDAMLLRGDW